MIFTGKGDGTFNAGVTVLSPHAELHDVVVADFNSDGKADLLYAINTAASGSRCPTSISPPAKATVPSTLQSSSPPRSASSSPPATSTATASRRSLHHHHRHSAQRRPQPLRPHRQWRRKANGTFKSTVTLHLRYPVRPASHRCQRRRQARHHRRRQLRHARLSGQRTIEPSNPTSNPPSATSPSPTRSTPATSTTMATPISSAPTPTAHVPPSLSARSCSAPMQPLSATSHSTRSAAARIT